MDVSGVFVGFVETYGSQIAYTARKTNGTIVESDGTVQTRHEMFAECFSLLLNNPDKLKAISTDLYDYMVSVSGALQVSGQ